MAKILLSADQHIHPHSNSLEKMEKCLEAFKWIFDTALKRDIKSVLCLGDLFHDRQRINILAYHRTYEILSWAKDQGLEVYLLTGNHDLYLREALEIYSIKPLEGIAKVISKPSTLTIEGLAGDFIPFISNPRTRLKELFPIPQRKKVLFGHLAVEGGMVNKLWGFEYKEKLEEAVEMPPTEERVEIDCFTGYQKVYLGHFHSRQCLAGDKKIQYIGSPLQINYGDAMDPRGVEILDTETLETEFVENDFSPRYFIFPFDEDLSKYNLKGAHVRLITPPGFGNSEIISLKKKIQEDSNTCSIEMIASRRPEANTIEAKLESSMLFTENREETLRKYLEHNPTPPDLDRELLLRIGLEMSGRTK